jgi:teichuronic acid biosynthesis glycosyltransferase TuaH
MKFNFIIIPYRDTYFLRKYGYSVRDLMIIKTLIDLPLVNKIYLVNRPVSLYERFTNKLFKKKIASIKVKVIDTTSYDLIGPLKGRIWTETCYYNIFNRLLDELDSKINLNQQEINILLDFTPIANIPYDEFKKRNFIIWYDVIDNFTKHNRYSEKEKHKVREKYRYVDIHADIITGVTSEALNEFPTNKNKLVMYNGLLRFDSLISNEVKEKYKFGFIGFITDKLDVDFIIEIAKIDSVVLYGEFYDRKIRKQLEKIKNVILKGGYKIDQLPRIMNSFEIGIIPYKESKSHDGSPLKLYQYLYFNKPVISAMQFEDKLMNLKFVKVVKKDDEVLEFINWLEKVDKKNISKYLRREVFWDYKILNILNHIWSMYYENSNFGDKRNSK